jgi:hypothetical protein
MKPFLAGLALAALLGAPAAIAQISHYDSARADYDIGHFEQAFAEFATLADEGHCDAARVAQQMVSYGKPLYAIEFKVAPERLERWRHLSGCPATTLARR